MKRILATILLTVVALIIMVNHFHNRKPSVQSRLIFPDFSRAACSRIHFVDLSDTASLIRRGATWYVLPIHQQSPNLTGHVRIAELEYPADTALVEKALLMIGSMRRLDLISSNPEKQAEFEVDSNSALFVECQDSNGTSLGGAYIGKTAETYDFYYVRPKGSNDVYSAPGGLRFALFANRERWLEKRVVPFDPSAAKALKITSADSGTIELVKADAFHAADSGEKNEWMIVSPIHTEADAKKVDFLLTSMAQFKAVTWEGDMTLTDSVMGLTRPSVELDATLANGKTKTLIIGGNKVAMKWIRNPAMPKITFTAYAYNMHIFDPGLTGMRDNARAQVR